MLAKLREAASESVSAHLEDCNVEIRQSFPSVCGLLCFQTGLKIISCADSRRGSWEIFTCLWKNKDGNFLVSICVT